MSLIEELDRLSLALDSLNEHQASSIIGYVNQIIDDQLHPHIIDILWKQEGINRVILMPEPGMCLERSGRGQAGAYSIPQEQEVTENTRGVGLWAWAYKTAKPVWLENISKIPSSLANGYLVAADAKSNNRIKNEATEEDIDPRYFSAFHRTDSIMVVPLFSRNLMCGIYSMELPVSGLLTRQTLDLLTQLAKPLARILYKVEVTQLTFRHTSRAIELFRESVRQTQPLLLNEFRSAFIARPFKPKMKKLEEHVARYFLEKGIKAEHYRPTAGRPQILEDIVRAIRSSHFVIADITGNNPNVLLELGVAIDHRKDILIFKRGDDRVVLPVDLSSYRIYEYEVDADGRIHIIEPTGGSTPCEFVLEEFVKKLEHDMRFLLAKPWNPTKPKRDSETGRVIDQKSDGEPIKGVRKEE